MNLCFRMGWCFSEAAINLLSKYPQHSSMKFLSESELSGFPFEDWSVCFAKFVSREGGGVWNRVGFSSF